MPNDPTTPIQDPPAGDPVTSPGSVGDPPVAQDTAPASAPVAAEKPEGLDDRFFDPAEGVKWNDLLKEYGELSEFKAKADEAANAIPKDGADYKLEFQDGQLPEGFEINPDDPLWNVARETALKAGWTQEQFQSASSAMIGILSQQEAGLQAQMQELAKAEAAKLGANAAAMSDSVTQWINNNFSDEAAKVLASSGVLVNAEVIKSFTKAMQALSSAGVSSLAANGRVSPSAVPEGFSSWTFDQRMEFARQKQAASG